MNPTAFTNKFDDKCFPYSSVVGKDNNNKCYQTGTINDKLYLYEAQDNAIDGPISLGRKDARGAVWMRFELVE